MGIADLDRVCSAEENENAQMNRGSLCESVCLHIPHCVWDSRPDT